MKSLLPTSTPLSVNRKGFTLIELLVVIAIVAILSVVGATIFSGTQGRARDSRRQQDIIAISKAMESNKVAGALIYPQISSSWFAGGVIPAEAAGYTPQYSIVYTTASGSVAPKPTAWADTSANPTAPTGTSVATVAAGVPSSGSIYTFQICALLEQGTSPNIYCVPSVQ